MAENRRGRLGNVRLRGKRRMNAGEIFWVEFPTRGGRAQAGRRPAIVVQKEKTLPNSARPADNSTRRSALCRNNSHRTR